MPAGCCWGAVRVAWSAAARWWAACAGGPRALGDCVRHHATYHWRAAVPARCCWVLFVLPGLLLLAGGLRALVDHVPLGFCVRHHATYHWRAALLALLLGAVRVAWSAAACWWAACAGGPRALGVLRETPCHVPLAGCSACSLLFGLLPALLLLRCCWGGGAGGLRAPLLLGGGLTCSLLSGWALCLCTLDGGPSWAWLLCRVSWEGMTYTFLNLSNPKDIKFGITFHNKQYLFDRVTPKNIKFGISLIKHARHESNTFWH